MSSPYVKIKTLLLEHGLTIAGLAQEFREMGIKCSREELSKTIRCDREYPHLRQAIADYFSTTVEKLFGSQRISHRAKQRRAA